MHQGMAGREVPVVPGLSAQSSIADMAIHMHVPLDLDLLLLLQIGLCSLVSAAGHIFSLNSDSFMPDLYSNGFFLGGWFGFVILSIYAFNEIWDSICISIHQLLKVLVLLLLLPCIRSVTHIYMWIYIDTLLYPVCGMIWVILVSKTGIKRTSIHLSQTFEVGNYLANCCHQNRCK